LSITVRCGIIIIIEWRVEIEEWRVEIEEWRVEIEEWRVEIEEWREREIRRVPCSR